GGRCLRPRRVRGGGRAHPRRDLICETNPIPPGEPAPGTSLLGRWARLSRIYGASQRHHVWPASGLSYVGSVFRGAPLGIARDSQNAAGVVRVNLRAWFPKCFTKSPSNDNNVENPMSSASAKISRSLIPA